MGSGGLCKAKNMAVVNDNEKGKKKKNKWENEKEEAFEEPEFVSLSHNDKCVPDYFLPHNLHELADKYKKNFKKGEVSTDTVERKGDEDVYVFDLESGGTRYTYKYAGGVENGRLHGKGVLETYIGNIKVNKVDGTWNKGVLAHGKEENDYFEYEGRYGQLEFDDKEEDTMTCFDGPDAKLTFRDAEKDPSLMTSYAGAFKEGRFSGEEGVATYADGSSYVGAWENGQREGKGQFTGTRGLSYDGNWSCDRVNGRGEIKLASGDKYEGTFSDGELTGKGEFTKVDGEIYHGEMSKGFYDGEGEHWGANGDYYKGTMRMGYFHGKGRLERENGDRINAIFGAQGDFVWGKPHGVLICTFDKKSGIFQFDSGELIGPTKVEVVD